MPQAAVIAGIQGAGDLGAAYLNYRGQREAQRTQAKAGVRAEVAEREDRKQDSRRWQQRWDDYQQRRQEWLARNTPITHRVNVPGATSPQPTPRPNVPQPGPVPGRIPSAMPAQRTTLGSLMGIPPLAGTGPAQQQQGSTLADLSQWGNWRGML